MVCNLTGSPAEAVLPEAKGEILISNYPDTTPKTGMTLRPWEAFAVKM